MLEREFVAVGSKNSSAQTRHETREGCATLVAWHWPAGAGRVAVSLRLLRRWCVSLGHVLFLEHVKKRSHLMPTAELIAILSIR